MNLEDIQVAEKEVRGKPGDFVFLGQVSWKEILRWRFRRFQERHVQGNEGSRIGQREKLRCDAAVALVCPAQLRLLELGGTCTVVPN